MEVGGGAMVCCDLCSAGWLSQNRQCTYTLVSCSHTLIHGSVDDYARLLCDHMQQLINAHLKGAGEGQLRYYLHGCDYKLQLWYKQLVHCLS